MRPAIKLRIPARAGTVCQRKLYGLRWREACAYAETEWRRRPMFRCGWGHPGRGVQPQHRQRRRPTTSPSAGNPFDGSSEPGIVWVMQDENGDGLPNDTWYELKGSEYGKEETIRDAVTYYRPSAPKMNVAWTDKSRRQRRHRISRSIPSAGHYYPAWVEADSYTHGAPASNRAATTLRATVLTG